MLVAAAAALQASVVSYAADLSPAAIIRMTTIIYVTYMFQRTYEIVLIKTNVRFLVFLKYNTLYHSIGFEILPRINIYKV